MAIIGGIPHFQTYPIESLRSFRVLFLQLRYLGMTKYLDPGVRRSAENLGVDPSVVDVNGRTCLEANPPSESYWRYTLW